MLIILNLAGLSVELGLRTKGSEARGQWSAVRINGVVLKKIYSFSNRALSIVIQSEQSERRISCLLMQRLVDTFLIKYNLK